MTQSSEDPFGWVGATLDAKYRVDEVVGRGGFGIVYRAHHLGFEEKVALKCLRLPKELAGQERDRFYESFMAEGRLLHQLSRSTAGIVQALDVGAAVSPSKIWTPYLVLEWLEGTSLDADFAERKKLQSGGRSLKDAIDLLDSAARALALAHEQGIAHRDIKPANLFIATVGGRTTLKVLDFGIAKVITESESLTKAFEATGGGLQAFTARYGAPEQFSRRFGATGPWTDVFALALVLVEAVVGRPALDGTDAAQLFVAASDASERPTLRTSGVEVGDAVEAVLTAALSVDPRERYPNAGAFWDAIVAAARVEPELAAAAPPSPYLQDSRPTRAETGASSRKIPLPGGASRAPMPSVASSTANRTELNSSSQIPAPGQGAGTMLKPSQWSSGTIGAVAGAAFVIGLIGATVWFIQQRRAQKIADTAATAGGTPSATVASAPPAANPPAAHEAASAPAPIAIPQPIAEAAPGRLPGIPARDVAAGAVEGSGAWLNKFKVVRQERSQGLAFNDAFARCVEIGMVLCTESQWQLACAQHPVLAQAPSWTDSVDQNGLVVRGGGVCTERKVAQSVEADPARIGLCCDRAIAMTTSNLQRTFLSSTAGVILKLENALNQRNTAGFAELLDDTVTIDGVARPKAKVASLLEQSFKATPDLVIVNDVCDVSVQANKTYKRSRRGAKKPVYSTSSWTAACRQSRHQDAKVVSSTTTYVFDPTSNLKSISETKSASAE